MSSYIRVCESVLKSPLLETNKANLIEFYSNKGELNALLFKQFNNDTFMLVTKGDADWPATLIRLGYVNVKSSPNEFLNQIKNK